MAKFANDSNETQIQYDLYRIPFNDGQGGVAEPIRGASDDGMSNSFPKISPDGRWLVYVRARNGMLIRPDSQLYIVPASGGVARRLNSNASPMNSWHSFSPNARWLAFSSKRRSPYTQLYLTHIDADGNDSPAILVENATASNRAVNIPEFVNIPPDGLVSIGGAAIDYYRFFDRAAYLQKSGSYADAAAEWRRVLETKPDDPLAHENLGMALLLAGRRDEASAEVRTAEDLKLRKAIETAPTAELYDKLGAVLLEGGRADQAVSQFQKAVQLDPKFAPAHVDLGNALASQGRFDDALAELRKAIDADPKLARAYSGMASILNGRRQLDEAIELWRKGLELDPSDAEAYVNLGVVLFARGEFAESVPDLLKASELAPNNPVALSQAAWALATCPEAKFRDGDQAESLAGRAVQLTRGNDATALDALAAAYAEKQQFENAALTARRAEAQAAKENQPYLAAAIHRRVAQYESKEPYRAGKP